MPKVMQTIYDSNGNVMNMYMDSMKTISFNNMGLQFKPMVIKRTISRKLVPTTEERLEEYIQENYDRYIIGEYGSYVYQMIQQKAYDIASEVVEEAKEDYTIDDEDIVIESIMEEIDFDSLYDLIEDILHAPITMEEKLADVGMSMRDFL
jgi:hypothetical protein